MEDYTRTTRAVYYRDDSMNDWELYNLVSMITAATFLQADYCGGNIRVAGPRSDTKPFLQILKSKLD